MLQSAVCNAMGDIFRFAPGISVKRIFIDAAFGFAQGDGIGRPEPIINGDTVNPGSQPAWSMHVDA
jgi:hypothetical protein